MARRSLCSRAQPRANKVVANARAARIGVANGNSVEMSGGNENSPGG